MINKNTSTCNRTISFESILSYIGISTLLGKAKFKKCLGADAFTILIVLISSVFKGYPNLYRVFESTEGKSCSFSRDATYRFLFNPKYD